MEYRSRSHQQEEDGMGYNNPSLPPQPAAAAGAAAAPPMRGVSAFSKPSAPTPAAHSNILLSPPRSAFPLPLPLRNGMDSVVNATISAGSAAAEVVHRRGSPPDPLLIPTTTTATISPPGTCTATATAGGGQVQGMPPQPRGQRRRARAGRVRRVHGRRRVGQRDEVRGLRLPQELPPQGDGRRRRLGDGRGDGGRELLPEGPDRAGPSPAPPSAPFRRWTPQPPPPPRPPQRHERP
ncbi:ZF-HD homeobox protein [Iris pallida]|uniref:ZF-HD homeobox protein n=1 Tax=Iris pallida TaxID=29817 RepID=A0AAX6GJG8_IRIPA|nr:ZF-HD homeobox protein [Iris pallida]